MVKRKRIFNQCGRCKRIRYKDGTWHKLDKAEPDMILKQVTCQDCQQVSQYQSEIAEDLAGVVLESLTKTPGDDFDRVRDLAPMQITKYQTIIKSTILMYLRENDIPR
jgi:hypothetical protein